MPKITIQQYDNQDVRFLTDDVGEVWINFSDFMSVNQISTDTMH